MGGLTEWFVVLWFLLWLWISMRLLSEWLIPLCTKDEACPQCESAYECSDFQPSWMSFHTLHNHIAFLHSRSVFADSGYFSPLCVFSNKPPNCLPERMHNHTGCICLTFSTVQFQMSIQIACLRGYIFILSRQMVCLRGCIITLVTFVQLFSASKNRTSTSLTSLFRATWHHFLPKCQWNNKIIRLGDCPADSSTPHDTFSTILLNRCKNHTKGGGRWKLVSQRE